MGDPKITDKRWTIDLEKRIQESHYDDNPNRYSFDSNSDKELFVIDTPPPYPSGTWHIGAVAQYSMIDVIARSQRLIGKEVLFPWGVDRNGINIEFTVEKKTGKKMRTYERGRRVAYRCGLQSPLTDLPTNLWIALPADRCAHISGEQPSMRKAKLRNLGQTKRTRGYIAHADPTCARAKNPARQGAAASKEYSHTKVTCLRVCAQKR